MPENKHSFSLIDFFIRLIDRFMSKFHHYETDKEFFLEEKNLYKEDGSLTDEYKAKIKEYEDYAVKESMSDILKEEEEFNDPVDQLVIDGFHEFTEKRSVLMKDYESKKKEEGPLFNPYEWTENVVTAGIENDKEIEERKAMISEVFIYDAKANINDPETEEVFKTMYKKGGEYE